MSGMDQSQWQTGELGAESGPWVSFILPTWGDQQVSQMDLTEAGKTQR